MTAWIFQGNPKLFDVDAYLARERNVLWGANQGFTMMKPGDLVYFWRSRGEGSSHSGIIASGVMTEEPREQPSDAASAQYWRTVERSHARQVAVRVEVPAGQRLLPAVYLASHPELRDLEILKVPNATNFRVGPTREDALASAWTRASTAPGLALLIEGFSPVVEEWRKDGQRQQGATVWIEAVRRARKELATLFRAFLAGSTSLEALRRDFDQRTRSEFWQPLGLAGPNGAMVLNKWTKHFPQEEMTARLQVLLTLPENVDQGRARLQEFYAYLQSTIDSGARKPAETGIARTPAFVSAIWEALDEGGHPWPTLYTSARDALFESDLLLRRDNPVETYFEFRELLLAMTERFGLPIGELQQLLKWADARTEPAQQTPPLTPERSVTRDASVRPIWLIAAGQEAVNWEAWKEQGIAAVGWNDLGDLRQYSSVEAVGEALKEHYRVANPINNRWACFDFAHSMQVGDIVFAKSGRNRLLGVGRVAGEYRYEPTREPEQSTRRVEWLDTAERKLDLNFNVKTLTEVDPRSELGEALRAFYSPEKSAVETVEPHVDVEPYTLADACKDLFIDEGLIEDMLLALRTKKNLILQGPPGVGKTFVAKRLAYLLMEQRAHDQVSMVQFHQSYSYEDFVQGFRPTADGGFRRENGPFFRFCELARQDPRSPYVLIIDEINRGNVSRIFGELLMLLEADKRGPEWAVELSYGTAQDPPFHIPANLHVIGTMNTADRSLALVDYALRRRFAFLDVPPGFDSPEFTGTLKALGVPAGVADRIRSVLGDLNALIAKDPNLGSGYLVGHSYFCDASSVARDEDWLERVFRMELDPLLREYFRDSPSKLTDAQKLLARL